jgi:hypothetical protein
MTPSLWRRERMLKLPREVEVVLPIELSPQQQIVLLERVIQMQFVKLPAKR